MLDILAIITAIADVLPNAKVSDVLRVIEDHQDDFDDQDGLIDFCTEVGAPGYEFLVNA